MNSKLMACRTLGAAMFLWAGTCAAQAPAAPPAGAETKPPEAKAAEAKPADAAQADVLADLAWLAGCWTGEASRREFREQWMPLRGGMILGVSQTVGGGITTSFEYLRIERRPDGVHYVLLSGGKTETALKFDRVSAAGGATTYTFANPALEFPRQLSYRREPDGRLVATLTGKVRGAERDIVYAMRRIDCEK